MNDILTADMIEEYINGEAAITPTAGHVAMLELRRARTELENLRAEYDVQAEMYSLNLAERDALVARVAELEATQQWTSIRYKLPPRNTVVLVYVTPPETYGPGTDVRTAWADVSGWKSYDGYIRGWITHWMPLPKPPEDKE